MQKLVDANTAIAVPTGQGAGEAAGGANTAGQDPVEEANTKKGKEEKKDPPEKTLGRESTGNSSNNPGSTPTDAMIASTQRQTSSISAAFDSVKAIKEAMEKVESADKEKYPRSMPLIKMNRKYKPMEHITKVPHFFKYVPPVYSDALNYDFDDTDYELVERDKQFLRDLNAKIEKGNGTINTNVAGQTINQEQLTEHDFERFIDVLDKIYQETKSKQDAKLLALFFDLADQSLLDKVSKPFLTVHLLPYWKVGKRFTRKFWENPDANDPDVTAAFRKRNEAPKMQLRRNEQCLMQKLDRKR